MTSLSFRILPPLSAAAIVVLVLSTAWTAVENRRTIQRNIRVIQALEEVQSATRADAKERAFRSQMQHDQQINQLRRGQRCIIYSVLFPTSAWTDKAIVLCLREGTLPKGIP